MKTIGIIPARYASTRFPGKPLIMIEGISMIMRVYRQALKSAVLSKVIVATDDRRIFDHVKDNGGEVVMTSASHVSGTSRISEVIEILAAQNMTFEVVVNIQGDEPFIDPLQINLAVSLFSNPEVQIGTLVKRIDKHEDLSNPNVVKVVVDHKGRSLFYSRSAIPYLRGIPFNEWNLHHSYFRHIGLYAYRSAVLKALVALPEAPSEIAESLEQLRWLHHGYSIYTALTDIETVGIDAPEDLLKLTNNL